LSALFHFGDAAFVGKSPGGDEFFGFLKNETLWGDEVEVVSVVGSAKTFNVVHVVLSDGETNAFSVVEEFELVTWGPEPDFTGGHTENLEKSAAVPFVFVDLFGRDGDFLFVDDDASLQFLFGSWENADDDLVFGFEDESDFFLLLFVVSGEDDDFFGGIAFITGRAGVEVVAWVGNHHDVPDVSEMDGEGLVVEGPNGGLFDGARSIVLCSKSSRGDSADRAVHWVNGQSLADVWVKADVVEEGVTDWRLDVDVDGFKISGEVDLQVDLSLFVLGDGIFAHVWVSKVSHDAVDLVGHVLDAFWDVFVFHGEVVLVEYVSFLGDLLLSGLKFVSLFHLLFGQLSKRMTLQVLFAFLAALEFSSEDDLSSGLALFAKVELGTDLSFLIVFEGLDKVNQWSFWHLALSVQTDFVLLVVDDLAEVREKPGLFVDWA